jgi:hypothetical protein
LKKPAGRSNAGFFTGFSDKTGFLKQAYSVFRKPTSRFKPPTVKTGFFHQVFAG